VLIKVMNQNELDHAVSLLRSDNVVGMPTETVYGLAGSIHSEKALKKIFSTKERPFFDPLIVHISSVDQAKSLTLNWHKAHEVLAKRFWPGPLTLVVEKSSQVSDLITSGLTTVGIRMPNHGLALKLITSFGSPLAAPSANKFGKTSPTSAQHVRDEFIHEDVFVLDGGLCAIGVESTVLYVKQESDESDVSLSLLRAGHVILSDICNVLDNEGLIVKINPSETKIAAPGQMKHHYMPKKPLVFFNEDTDLKKCLPEIFQMIQKLPNIIESVNVTKPEKIESMRELVLSDKPEEAARELYAQLRVVSEGPEDIIYFKKKSIHLGENWEAILDRLGKAATIKY
jgi:L-threonylcarbamoyladenylate synthase